MVGLLVGLQLADWRRVVVLQSRFRTRAIGVDSDDEIVQVLIADGVVDFEFRFLFVEAIQNKAILFFFEELAHHSLFVSGAFTAILVVNHSLSHGFLLL